MTSVDTLVADLTRLGVAAGDTLMVHASLHRIGPVDGGAAGVIAALERAVGPDGSLLMTLGARDDWNWVNDRPERERAALLAGTPAFDAGTTPADPDVGALAEVFRRSPGTAVSNHPEGRFGARGRLASALLESVPWDDYCGPGSPLERLCAADGRVLRMGAGEDTVTLIHYAEYLAPLAVKRRVVRHRMVTGPDGPILRTISCLDDCDGIVDHAGEDYFALILRAYLAEVKPPRGRVGGAVSELLDAANLAAFAVRWMTEHLAPPT